MVVRLVALLSRQLFRLVLLACRSSRSKDIELLVLRQEVGVLRRQVNRPKVRPEERIVLSVLRNQAVSIVACDLFTVESIRMKTLHVLFFIDLHSRRVMIGGVTGEATNLRWCTQIARNLSEARESRSTPLRFLVHDRDKRFGAMFDEVFKAEGVEIIRTPWRAPRANAYAERFVRTVRTECVDWIFILNERHLESVLKTYVNHYNQERPHRGLDLRIPAGGLPVRQLDANGSIARRARLGGLIHEYHRKAA
jgi:putative transposase